ncbi:MAG: molybdopterin-dependent oxidoreductase [Planctomycetia bacterium]|nr:molybdopterin-dependent oxidoreductase [Planctomycetia bacterium]
MRQNGAKLIVIDPRKIELVKYADIHLQLRAGTNVALINGLLHVIIKRDCRMTKGVPNFERSRW